jgi:hypothetical protein
MTKTVLKEKQNIYLNCGADSNKARLQNYSLVRRVFICKRARELTQETQYDV